MGRDESQSRFMHSALNISSGILRIALCTREISQVMTARRGEYIFDRPSFSGASESLKSSRQLQEGICRYGAVQIELSRWPALG